jgi:hypothetical protein
MAASAEVYEKAAAALREMTLAPRAGALSRSTS